MSEDVNEMIAELQVGCLVLGLIFIYCGCSQDERARRNDSHNSHNSRNGTTSVSPIPEVLVGVPVGESISR